MEQPSPSPSLDHVPTLAEMAAAANQLRNPKPSESPDMDKSWFKTIANWGLGALIAVGMLLWMKETVNTKLDDTLKAATSTQSMQADLLKTMNAFVNEQKAARKDQEQQEKVRLLITRQTCLNGATTTAAMRACHGETILE